MHKVPLAKTPEVVPGPGVAWDELDRTLDRGQALRINPVVLQPEFTRLEYHRGREQNAASKQNAAMPCAGKRHVHGSVISYGGGESRKGKLDSLEVGMPQEFSIRKLTRRLTSQATNAYANSLERSP
jgi:hypothetical protein